jgi:xylulose-5-phosphate/fructose-6-phosphate phosphoketolase
MSDKLVEHTQFIHQYGEDLPEVAGWKWEHK